MNTEPSTMSVSSNEPEYKDSIKTCKSFLLNSKLPVLPEHDEENFDQLQLQASPIALESKSLLKAKENKVRQ